MKLLILAVGSILLGTVFGIGATVAHFQWNSSGTPTVAVDDPALERSAPKVTVDNQHFDFGTMERGSKMDHAFVFTNTGGSPLTLKVTKTSCKCTVGSLEKNEIQPGESANVVLEWKAEALNQRFSHGATLETNDPNRRLLNLAITGKVIQSVTLEPPALIFGKAMIDQETTGEVRLLAYKHDAIELLDFEAVYNRTAELFDVKSERLTAEELEGTDAKSGLRIHVTIKPGMAIGRFEQRIELFTNMAGRSSVGLPIRGMAAGPITISGPGWSPETGVLALGGLKSTDQTVRDIRITVRGEHRKNFRIEKVGFKGQGLAFHLGEKKTLGAVEQYILSIKVSEKSGAVNHLGGQPDSKLAEFLLKTNHPLAEYVKIPVSFAIEQ